jgi:hypothetical protein
MSDWWINLPVQRHAYLGHLLYIRCLNEAGIFRVPENRK